MSSTPALLPLNWLAAAARLTVSAAAPSALRVAEPNLNVSSQNTTKMPLGAVESGTKPTLTASVMGKSSENQGGRRAGIPPKDMRILCSTADLRPSSAGHLAHYGLSPA